MVNTKSEPHKSGVIRNWLSENWVLIIALATSLAVQLSFISKSSIWHDEGYSLWLIKFSPFEIITRTIRDVHPPFYYEVLKLWTTFFGTSEVAVRSLSSVCILGVIGFMYFLVKRLFGAGAARATAFFLAVAPFMVRYGQEARMYALVALLVTAATYYVVVALDQRSKAKLFLYAILMALAFYTHYYSVFIVPVQWLYVLLRTQWGGKKRTPGQLDLLSPWWWLANATIVLLFIPWLPSAYQQFTRVQGGFWIPAVTITTLPATIAQFLQYTSLDSWATAWRVLLAVMIVVLSTLAVVLNRKQRNSLVLLATWAILPLLVIFVLSAVSRPVYVDRYFVYASVAFYALLAVLFYVRPLNYLYKVRPVLLVLVLVIFGYGISNVYRQSSHQMREVAQFSNQDYRAGDQIISGELYTYLDYSYYNSTNQPVYLYAPKGISGYGETSLIYNQPQLVVESFSNVAAPRIWLVGKTGDKSYYQEVPTDWKLLGTKKAGDSEIRLYQQT